MEKYKIRELLPGYIDDTESGRQLLEWYRFVSGITYMNNKVKQFQTSRDYDLVIKFYENKFNIDVSPSSSSLSSPGLSTYYINVIKAYITLLIESLSTESIVCDAESLNKLLFYDIDFLFRLSNMYDKPIYQILTNVITNTREYDRNMISYEIVTQPEYNDINISDGTDIYIYNGGELPEDIINIKVYKHYKGTIPNHVEYVSIGYLTPNVILPSSLVKLECKYITKNYILPKSLKYLKINDLRTQITFPENLECLHIGYLEVNIFLPLNLKALTLFSSDYRVNLPFSLVYLRVGDDMSISHLDNLKVLIYDNTGGDIYPSNIKYLYHTARSRFDHKIRRLKKLKYLITSYVNDVGPPPTVTYLMITESCKELKDNNVTYLMTNNENSIPINVKFLFYTGPKDINVDKYKDLEVYLHIIDYHYKKINIQSTIDIK